jgi:di/tricarboxylate transporter
MPTPAGLTLAGQSVLACFSFALVLWVTESIPTHVTSLTLMVNACIYGCMGNEKRSRLCLGTMLYA